MFQLGYSQQAGVPNSSSLVEAHVDCGQFGVCDRVMAKNVRAVKTDDVSDCQCFLKGKCDLVDFTIHPLPYATPNAGDVLQN